MRNFEIKMINILFVYLLFTIQLLTHLRPCVIDIVLQIYRAIFPPQVLPLMVRMWDSQEK